MRLGTRVWSVGKFFLLVGALGATFSLFFLLSMRAALRAREVEVPELAGLTVNQATESLASIGLGLRVDENRRADPKVPLGRVMQQDPSPGMRARRQRTIRVWVSSGPRVTIVPALIGQSDRTARIRLDQEGVQIGTVSEIRSTDYPADAVVSQNPAPQSRAPEASMLVNRGEQETTYVMPDLIGMDGGRAAEIMRSRGFRVTIVGTQPVPGMPADTIIRQQPDGGYKISAADPISLEVSR
jgi:eukaryotic-like serine/threonine-protein kinase